MAPQLRVITIKRVFGWKMAVPLFLSEPRSIPIGLSDIRQSRKSLYYLAHCLLLLLRPCMFITMSPLQNQPDFFALPSSPVWREADIIFMMVEVILVLPIFWFRTVSFGVVETVSVAIPTQWPS